MVNYIIGPNSSAIYKPDMYENFSEAFNAHLEKRKVAVTAIAKGSGVSKESLYSLKYGKTLNMSVDDAIRVAAYFGETVEEFMGLTGPRVDDALIRRIEGLSPRERALLQAAIDAFLAPPDPAAPPDDRDAAQAASSRHPKDDPDP